VRLPEICIERPVLATVLSLAIVLFGAISLTRLPNNELPDVEPPSVSISTVLPGAAAEVVETSVTQPIEDEIMGIEGIRHVTSVSREQVSSIDVEFELSRDVDEAANDVRDRVARVRRDLPEAAEAPVVSKRSASSGAVLWIALYGENYNQIELSTLAETRIKDRLSKLPGVASVIIGGERRFAMRVWIDNERLTAHRLSVSDVVAALQRENVDIPSGRIEGEDVEFTVRTLGELQTRAAFETLIVTEIDGAPIRLRDVARVEVGAEDERKLVRFNGAPAVGLGVVKQSKANTLAVVSAALREIEALRGEVPPGVRLDSAFDSSIFIRRAITDVTHTIFEAVILVLVVIYLFLRRARSTLIPAVAIPISVIGTFSVLDFAGFSINTLTLMGITLSIGVVVDDAIVVLENITRWVEAGTPPREAARRGMREITFAVLSTTLAVIAVFLPLAFLSDRTGRLFREFGVTVAAAVALSGFVALTLSPMLCSRVLTPSSPESGFKAWLETGFRRLGDGYRRWLEAVLRHHRVAVIAGGVWFAAGLLLLLAIPREFVPTADRGSFFAFTRAPEGATLEFTDRYQRELEKLVLETPEVEKAFSVVALGLDTPGSVNEGAIFATLHPVEDRKRSQQEVVAEVGQKFWQVPGLLAFPVNPPSLGRSFRSEPISLVIQGPDVVELAQLTDAIVERARALPGLVNVQSDLLLNKPQLEVEIDRDRASDLGVSAEEIATALRVLLGGADLSTFKLGGETYDVVAQLERSARAAPRDLLRVHVRGAGGQLTPLSSFVSVRETPAPRALPHFDRLRSATLTASLLPGTPLGESLEQVRAIAEEILPLERGYRITFSGESEDFYESGNALAFAYGLAVLIIFLVLAAQFESFLHPLIILIAVALSFTGALLSLLAVGDTLNLFSQIGLVMLVGLVTKNSILIVEFANQLRARGNDLIAATREAAVTRFRPILMTALSTIVGILPLALGFGAGGEARAPLGVAVVGGMLFSTTLTIFVVPAAYLWLERGRERPSKSSV